ncbi:hypothetical protein GCM10010275_44470 [Streptomyces litmocidini]|nr:hypothetical protein GCM10010275_44470 [Streptomyces litmocidini]
MPRQEYVPLCGEVPRSAEATETKDAPETVVLRSRRAPPAGRPARVVRARASPQADRADLRGAPHRPRTRRAPPSADPACPAPFRSGAEGAGALRFGSRGGAIWERLVGTG